MAIRYHIDSRSWSTGFAATYSRVASRESRRIPRCRWFRATCGLLLCSLLFSLRPSQSQTAEVSEVKAAYLYNFVKFVEWPPEAFHGADDPALICVVGDDRTGEVLQKTVVARKANGRRVEASHPRSASEFRACQVLFIGFSDNDRITGILRSLHDSNVLTVGQTDQFLSLGGMINLALRKGTIELEIDPEATDTAGLKVSSRLMVVSRIVSNRRRGGRS